MLGNPLAGTWLTWTMGIYLTWGGQGLLSQVPEMSNHHVDMEVRSLYMQRWQCIDLGLSEEMKRQFQHFVCPAGSDTNASFLRSPVDGLIRGKRPVSFGPSR